MLEENKSFVDPARLAEVRAANLLDTPREASFDQAASLASQIMDAPIALVSLVDARRQFFKSYVGPLSRHIDATCEALFEYSFCSSAVALGRELVIEDTSTHPLAAHHPLTLANGVGAYAGFPLVSATGHTLGVLCVLDTKPRQWPEGQLKQLEMLASLVSSLIGSRIAVVLEDALPQLWPESVD